MAGFPTPRVRIHIEGGTGADVLDGRASVIDEKGKDVTEVLLEAARAVETLAEALSIEKAYLKERSPSCGCRLTAGREGAREGMGVIAAALSRKGVEVIGID